MIRVINDVDYGDDDLGAIYLHDDYGEIVMWEMTEWKDEPSLVGVIVNAIMVGMSLGGETLRRRIGRCLVCELGATRDSNYCFNHKGIEDNA